jgi:hypothetical protein
MAVLEVVNMSSTIKRDGKKWRMGWGRIEGLFN